MPWMQPLPCPMCWACASPIPRGLGGSGFMVVYMPDEQCAYSLNYRATAGSRYPSDEILVPGLVMGMEEACRQWGTMSMAQLMDPAIDYANNGFQASADFVKRVQHYASVSSAPAFSGIKTGDTVVQTQLGSTMETIQKDGAAAFYTGQIAQDIAAKSTLSTGDIASYQVAVTKAPTVCYGGYTLYASDAPSSGVTVLQMMKLAGKAPDAQSIRGSRRLSENPEAMSADCLRSALQHPG